MGELGSHRKRSGSVGWTRTDLPGYFTTRRGICCAPRKRGCVYDHTTPTFTIQIQIIKSQIPNTGFRTQSCAARHQVLQSNEADRNLEVCYELAVQLKDASEKDDLGRSTVLEVSRPIDDSDVFESVED